MKRYVQSAVVSCSVLAGALFLATSLSAQAPAGGAAPGGAAPGGAPAMGGFGGGMGGFGGAPAGGPGAGGQRPAGGPGAGAGAPAGGGMGMGGFGGGMGGFGGGMGMGGFGGGMGGFGGGMGGMGMGGAGGNQAPAVDMATLPGGIRSEEAEKADDSGFPMVKDLKASDKYPEIMKFRDGTEVTKDNWPKRAEEIKKLYEYYMYGVWHDGSEVDVTYKMNEGDNNGRKSMTVTVTRKSTGKSGTFDVNITLPTASDEVKMPEGGWPVVLGMHGAQEAVAASRGYASMTFGGGGGFMGGVTNIAADNNRHTGLFYDLYPYGEDWKEQTGELLAWSWGISRIIDALEKGAGKELNINPKNTIVTGVSRYGKAAMVCGAFEPRIKMCAPSCSGAGGVAMYRYVSEGKTYDFSSKNDSKEYKYGRNEPIDSLQATGEQGWFNNKFMCFKDPKTLPVDQHMLAMLCADPNRYLFIIGSCTGEDWVNAPAMWLTFRAAKASYEKLGLGDHIVANIHKSGHAVTAEDMNYMIDYFNEKVYGIKSKTDLTCLTTSAFELPVNKDPLFDSFGGTVPPQPKPDPAPAANANGGQRPGGGMGGFGGGMGGFGGGMGGAPRPAGAPGAAGGAPRPAGAPGAAGGAPRPAGAPGAGAPAAGGPR